MEIEESNPPKRRGPKPPIQSVGRSLLLECGHLNAPNLYSTSSPYVRGFVNVPVRRKLSASDSASIWRMPMSSNTLLQNADTLHSCPADSQLMRVSTREYDGALSVPSSNSEK